MRSSGVFKQINHEFISLNGFDEQIAFIFHFEHDQALIGGYLQNLVNIAQEAVARETHVFGVEDVQVLVCHQE